MLLILKGGEKTLLNLFSSREKFWWISNILWNGQKYIRFFHQLFVFMFSDIATLSIACNYSIFTSLRHTIYICNELWPLKGRNNSPSRSVCVPEVHGVVGVLWRYTMAKWNVQHSSARECKVIVRHGWNFTVRSWKALQLCGLEIILIGQYAIRCVLVFLIFQFYLYCQTLRFPCSVQIVMCCLLLALRELHLAIIYEDSRHLGTARILCTCTTHPETFARENLLKPNWWIYS